MAQLREGSVIKKAGGDEVIATINDIPEIPTSLPADGGNADTVGGFTVGTNVPANAKFTDTNTITTINGKTGAISKADVVALGIPAQDTVYSHPSSHPASIITESTTKRFVSDTEKSSWNDANSKKHIHSNKSIIDELDDIGGNLTYKGKEIGVGGVFTIKREEFIAIQGQTVFNLTLGEYTPNANRLSVHIFGGMVSNSSLIETSRTSFTFKRGLDEGDKVIVEWIEAVDIEGLYQGGTFTGITKAQSNTSYTTAQIRNVIISPSDAVLSSMQDGEIWIKYE